MRMERINEHQVRCVITMKDLEEHKLTSGDLKYGTKEIKALFNEVLGQAVEHYQFNEEHLPVMIEAIPIQGGELLVILSAVDNVEELDPHFAHFEEDAEELTEDRDAVTGFADAVERPESGVCLFRFSDMGDVIRFSNRISGVSLHTELYRRSTPHRLYVAVFRQEDMEISDFHAFRNSLSEYAEVEEHGALLYAWLKEHGEFVLNEPHILLSSKP